MLHTGILSAKQAFRESQIEWGDGHKWAYEDGFRKGFEAALMRYGRQRMQIVIGEPPRDINEVIHEEFGGQL